MAWIESHQALKDHPKTRKLARLLDITTPAAIGHLHCFWWWALDYATDGDLSRYDSMDIAIGSEWEGDDETFVQAMATAGFIDFIDDGSLLVHDWSDYAGKLIARRESNAQRMRDARSTSVQDTCNARAEHVRTRVGLPNQPTIPTVPTVPNQPTKGAGDADLEAKFAEFWKAYPRKTDRKGALAKFAKVDWRDVEFDDVMAALERQKQSPQWTKDGGQFVPHATTWLNRERWNDEVPEPSPPTATAPRRDGGLSTNDLKEIARREREADEKARSGGTTDGTQHDMAGTQNRHGHPDGLPVGVIGFPGGVDTRSSPAVDAYRKVVPKAC